MTTREGEYELGNQKVETEEEMIDRLNKVSYWKTYVIVAVFYVGCSIWYGFSIHTAY